MHVRTVSTSSSKDTLPYMVCSSVFAATLTIRPRARSTWQDATSSPYCAKLGYICKELHYCRKVHDRKPTRLSLAHHLQDVLRNANHFIAPHQ